MTKTWPSVPFDEACTDVSTMAGRLPKGAWSARGELPVIDQGDSVIAGYTDDTRMRFRGELPVIVFGDHTRRFKFVDRPFVVGADGVKLLAASDPFDARFLYRFLASLDIPSAGYSRHFKFLKSMRVPLPPLDEQRRIARVLDAADQLRRSRRQALTLMNGLASAAFVSTFGDPLRNPRQWPLAKLGSLGTLERGVSKHRPRNAPHLLGGPYPLIQTGDVARSGGVITRYSSTYSEAGLEQSRLWPAGTLCITIAANIAQTGVTTFEACFPDSVVGFTASPALTLYVQVWLSFLQPILERSAPESAQKNINLATLRDLPVPTPPPAAMAEFAEFVTASRGLRVLHAKGLRRLDSVFESLQHRAFSGGL